MFLYRSRRSLLPELKWATVGELLDFVDSVELRPDKQFQFTYGLILPHCSIRCSAITSCPLLLSSTTALIIETRSEGRAVRRSMAKKEELVPPSVPTQVQVLSMPKAAEDEDSGAESESEWESEEDEEEEEEEGQSSDSGLGSQGSGHSPRQSRECKWGGRDYLDRGPYDPTPLDCFSSVELEVGQRCREWVTKITDPASRVSFFFIPLNLMLKGQLSTVGFLFTKLK